MRWLLPAPPSRRSSPRDKIYTVPDNRGLYAEVFPTGGIVWRYRYRLNGKYEKLTLGRYPALTLKNARLKRGEAAQRGRLIADVVTGKLDVREAAARLPDETQDTDSLDDFESESADEEAAADSPEGALEDAEA